MGIGGSIFLIALGAIFAFAVEADLGWLNLAVVGWVLMLAGVAGLLITLYFWNSRRRAVVAAPVRESASSPTGSCRCRTTGSCEEYREVRRPGRPV